MPSNPPPPSMRLEPIWGPNSAPSVWWRNFILPCGPESPFLFELKSELFSSSSPKAAAPIFLTYPKWPVTLAPMPLIATLLILLVFSTFYTKIHSSAASLLVNFLISRLSISNLLLLLFSCYWCLKLDILPIWLDPRSSEGAGYGFA
jgi:hypothetical protein